MTTQPTIQDALDAIETLRRDIAEALADIRRILDTRTDSGSKREPDVADAPLFAALKKWRAERASADGIAPYRIFGNAALTAIAERRPKDSFELYLVKGVGEAKAKEYGDHVLAIVASHDW